LCADGPEVSTEEENLCCRTDIFGHGSQLQKQ